MREKIVKVSEGAINITHNLAALLLAVATLLAFAQVVTRYVFNDPATWTGIMARGVVIWMVYLVSAAAFRYGAMISLTFIRNTVPRAILRWVMVLVTVMSLLFLAILVWYGTQMAIRVSGQQIAMLDISMAWFYAAIPIGSLFAIPGVLLAYALPREHEVGDIE